MSTVGFKARRLAAHFYDGLLVLAMVMTVTLVLLPLNHGNALTYKSIGHWAWIYNLVLLVVIAAYFGVSWCKRGQTLGLKTWGLFLQSPQGELASPADALKRLAVLFLLNATMIMGCAALEIGYAHWVVYLLLAPYLANLSSLLISGVTLEDKVSKLQLNLLRNQRAREIASEVTNPNKSNGDTATTPADHP